MSAATTPEATAAFEPGAEVVHDKHGIGVVRAYLPRINEYFVKFFGASEDKDFEISVPAADLKAPESAAPETVSSPASYEGFRSIALRANARGQRVLPIVVGEKNPAIKWKDTPIDALSTEEWAAYSTKWIEDCAAKFPEAGACVIAKPNEFCFIDEDKSEEFRTGYEAFAGEPFPRTFTTESRANHRQSHWLQTDGTRQLGNVRQTQAGDVEFSFRQHNLYVLSEGSLHPSGSFYHIVDNTPAIPMPTKLAEYIKHLREQAEQARDVTRLQAASDADASKTPIDITPDGPPIPYREHDITLFLIGRELCRRNPDILLDELIDRLTAICEKRCEGYGSDYADMCKKCAESALRYGTGIRTTVRMSGKAMDGTEARLNVSEPKTEPVGTTSPAPSPSQQPADQVIAEAVARKNSLGVAISGSFYKPGETVQPRIFIHEGFDALNTKIVWVGPEKAEKSLFALRKAMHEACGKDWLGYRSTGAIPVAYFDAENSTEDIDERYRELLNEFTSDEQQLINQKLSIFKGRQFLQKNPGADFNFNNVDFWTEYAARENNRGCVSYYLDCLYQFHSVAANDNEGLKHVIDTLHSYVGLERAFHVLHHTRGESNESLGKPKQTALRLIGARSWSNKIYGGKHIKKVADVVVCQERYEVREDSTVVESFIDFSFYSRFAADSTLRSFVDDGDSKYGRRLIISLSSGAQSVLYALQMAHGPWKSKYAAAQDVKSVCSQPTAYQRFKELVTKGYVIEARDGVFALKDSYQQTDEEIAERASKVIEITTSEQENQSKKWLTSLLASAPMPVEALKALAKKEGFKWANICKTRMRWGIESYENDGAQSWGKPEHNKTVLSV